MTRGFDNKELSTGYGEEFNKSHTPNDDNTIDPTLLGTQHSTAMRSHHSRGSHRRRNGQSSSPQITQGAPGALPSSRSEVRGRLNSQLHPRLDVSHDNITNIRQAPHQPPYQSPSQYPDAGLIDRGGSRYPVLHSSAIPGLRASPTTLQEQRTGPDIPPRKEANKPFTQSPKKRIRADTGLSADCQDDLEDASFESQKLTTPSIQSSRKRTRTDAGFSADAGDDLDDATFRSQKSTTRSKRTKTAPKYKDTGDEEEQKIRKVSKLKLKVAGGKAPQKGSLGPKGEVRTREDGRMEFRDVNNPEWTLAAYHNDYRREFLDEAAEEGEFDHAPARGEAEDDQTSYESKQQSWGPSRADWQNIVNSEGKKVMFEVEKPDSRRPPQEPGNWVHDGLVLLDLKNHPVKDWPGLNKTLSTEIESWRWEALMRMYPWLSVADLLARMPHTRVKKGEVVPLQTPQAFTNRAYRFRIPNQIPASNPKNGSATYREGIMENLAKKSAKTTEGLSTLDPSQVDKVRKGNKGKFQENSRYVVKKDEESTEAAPPSKKRKVRCDDDTESEPEQEAPGAKRPCNRTPTNSGVEIPSVNDLTWGSIHDHANEDVTFGSATFYDEPTDNAGPWDNQEQEGDPIDTMGPFEDQGRNYLVALFLSIEDRGLALVEDPTFTSPDAVIWARRNGNQQTGEIGVHWYRSNTPRYVAADGNTVEDVVHIDFWHQIEAEGLIPDDTEHTLQDDGTDNVASASTQDNTFPASDPFLSSHGGYQNTPDQTSYNLWTTVTPSSHAPPSVPSQIGRYQTQSDIADEVWRTQFGPAGF